MAKLGRQGTTKGSFKALGKGRYQRKGSAYQWASKGGKFYRVRGTAKVGPALKLKRTPKKLRPAPYNPLDPVTGKGLDRELDAALKLKYGGQERQLGAEERISRQQTANVGSWYDNYVKALIAAQTQTQAGYQQAQQGIYGQANAGATQDEAQRARLAQEAQQSAQLRGATVNPEVQAQAQQAAQANRALSSSFGGLVGTQGASEAAFAGTRRAAAGLSKVRALEDESRRARQIQALRRELATEKGSARYDLRRQLREEERKYALERQAFGLNVAKAEEDVRASQQRERNVRRGQRTVARSKRQTLKQQKMVADRRYQLDREKFGAAQAKERYQRSHGLGAYKPAGKKGGGGGGGGGGRAGGGLTPSQRRSYRDKWEGYVGNILYRPKEKIPGGANPLLVRAASEYVKNKRKGVSRSTAQKIKKRFGFNVRIYNAPKAKRPKGFWEKR
jgi:hypothetical protein